jgi:hypothetical protein
LANNTNAAKCWNGKITSTLLGQVFLSSPAQTFNRGGETLGERARDGTLLLHGDALRDQSASTDNKSDLYALFSGNYGTLCGFNEQGG